MSNQDDSFDLSRRKFFATIGAAAGSVAVGTLVCNEASAADLPPLQETDSLASRMNYKEDTTKVDDEKFPNHKPDQNCANCQYYQGADGESVGPCQFFPGKTVTSAGWCQVWSSKA